MVADSDPGFRSMVHGAAKACVPGSRVHSATDGTIALELLDSIKPHVLVLDMSLPEVNGLEIAASVVGDPDYQHLTIIAVSDTAGNRDAALMKSMGVDYFLTKPVDYEELSDLLRPLLERPMSISSPPAPAM